ncbi:hypothetical protein OGAPHI_006091 [Ogataea philodendri]|uniref:Protein kinase domain-containing protein n=1 Tax=Ogataea philodendri TaxID=1378263 RepID=A0A9P8NYN8_9ASCO|nr:uncharacterized protein OGAPHI_006091 [Ogataea philodendri]KAH3661912.1 hypothetical protein OGAPHI_006091 [Ogataea philodendri]
MFRLVVPIVRARTLKLAVGVGAGTVSAFYLHNSLLNEAKVTKGLYKNAHVLSNKNSLVADPKQSTYEMGLYMASQTELEQESVEIRREQKSRKLTGWLYYLKYWLLDYIWEPTVTVSRFLELTSLFVPIFAFYPIVFFGKRNHKGETSGALLWYKLVRKVAELAGASFIKLGQWAASRTDIFSRGLCDELGQLHSNAKSHSFRYTRKVIETTFGDKKLEDVFDEFDPVPIGCGAIAQVYTAKLNPKYVEDGQEQHVAVKVVHPNIEVEIDRDLRIMRFFANAIDIIPTMEWLSFPQEVEQFSMLMKMQLDLRIEGNNLLKFQEKFPDDDIRFPTPFMKISSRKILVEEQIRGLSMSKVLELRQGSKHVTKEMSDTLIDAFLKMLILDNFIHADLHPGNIFIRFVRRDPKTRKNVSSVDEIDELMARLGKINDVSELATQLDDLSAQNYHPQVCLIDAGLVTELDDTDRYNFISLFNALSHFDGYQAGSLMIERSKTPGSAIDTEIFKMKVERLVDRVKQRTFTLGSISIGDLLDQMLSMVRSHHVRMDGDFITVIVAILLMEGIGRQLDPDLDLFARCVFAWNVGFPTY